MANAKAQGEDKGSSLVSGKGLQSKSFGVTLSVIVVGGYVIGFGVAANDDATSQWYFYIGGGAGYDVSVGLEVIDGDNAMLRGISRSGSAGGNSTALIGGFVQHSRDGNGNSSSSGGVTVGIPGGGGSFTETKSFATPPMRNQPGTYNGMPGSDIFFRGTY